MNILLSPETLQLLEQRMKEGDYSSPDEIVRVALERLEPDDAQADDVETRAAIQRGIADVEAGRTRPWAHVKRELMARYPKL